MKINTLLEDYRRDIDGLRAFAVLLVIFFHLDLNYFSGGYIGVDVFYVISGFLITHRIADLKYRENLVLSAFYAGRVKRLFPALLSTITVTVTFSFFVMTPEKLIDTIESSFYAVLSLSNFYFYFGSGYWDSASWSKPLLHTWSLAVEEQFYFIWPLLLLTLIYFVKRFLVAFLVLIVILSVFVSTTHTANSPSSAFYLMPFRVYEFALGALCVFVPPFVTKFIFRAVLTYLGLCLIFISNVIYDHQTPFPSYNALLPCIGACLVIVFGDSRSFCLLSNPVSSYLGKISYSLYLIHWPVIVFARGDYGVLSTSNVVLALTITFILAVFQYHLVEEPMRKKLFKGKKPLLPSLLLITVSALIFACLTLNVLKNSGYPERFNDELQRLANVDLKSINKERTLAVRKLCSKTRSVPDFCGSLSLEKPNILILGDSHGPDGLTIMNIAFPEYNYLYSGKGGCPPLFSLEGIIFADKNCTERNQRLFQAIRGNAEKIDAIALSIRMSKKRNEKIAEFVEHMSLLNIPVILFGPGPHFKQDVSGLIYENDSFFFGKEELPELQFLDHFSDTDYLIDLLNQFDGIYIDKAAYFCPNQICDVLTPAGNLVSYDAHHLTAQAAEEFAGSIKRDHADLLRSINKKDSSKKATNEMKTEGIIIDASEKGYLFRIPKDYKVSQLKDGILISGIDTVNRAGGMTSGVSVNLGRFENLASERNIEISVTGKAHNSNSSVIAIAYSTNDVGNSGWHEYSFKNEFKTYSFAYNVPKIKNGGGDYVGISLRKGAFELKTIRVRILTSQ